VDRSAVDRAFGNLVISKDFVRQIGPAVNSGRAILLYGLPGNGKTSIAERVGRLFTDIIYIPYCVDVEGQIVKVFDPGVHKAAQRSTEGSTRDRPFDAKNMINAGSPATVPSSSPEAS